MPFRYRCIKSVQYYHCLSFIYPPLVLLTRLSCIYVSLAFLHEHLFLRGCAQLMGMQTSFSRLSSSSRLATAPNSVLRRSVLQHSPCSASRLGQSLTRQQHLVAKASGKRQNNVAFLQVFCFFIRFKRYTAKKALS